MYIDGTVGVQLATVLRAVVGDAPADKEWSRVHKVRPSIGQPNGIQSYPGSSEVDEPSDTPEPTPPRPEDVSTKPAPLEHTDNCVSQQPCSQDDIRADDGNEPIDPQYRRALVVINARTSDVTCTLNNLGAGVRKKQWALYVQLVYICACSFLYPVALGAFLTNNTCIYLCRRPVGRSS